ncbi:MAG: thiamine phosphate synthase [Bacteroidota bacterium]|jgi:thiamine-phosphate pyrophosphorylase
MEIIVLTTDFFFDDEVNIIQQLFHVQLTKLHIRKPNATIDEIRNLLHLIPSQFHPKIVLHQYPELLTEYNIAGFHITQFNKKNEAEIRNLLQAHQSISISCHSFAEIENLNYFDYYFISPIFNSISKKNYASNFSEDAIFKGLQINTSKKIIALGGINVTNIASLKKFTFSGAAILGGLWQSANIIEEWKKLMEK